MNFKTHISILKKLWIREKLSEHYVKSWGFFSIHWRHSFFSRMVSAEVSANVDISKGPNLPSSSSSFFFLEKNFLFLNNALFTTYLMPLDIYPFVSFLWKLLSLALKSLLHSFYYPYNRQKIQLRAEKKFQNKEIIISKIVEKLLFL